MPNKLKKESKEYQYNLARQQFLNLNGIKVKLDGSWVLGRKHSIEDLLLKLNSIIQLLQDL